MIPKLLALLTEMKMPLFLMPERSIMKLSEEFEAEVKARAGRFKGLIIDEDWLQVPAEARAVMLCAFARALKTHAGKLLS